MDRDALYFHFANLSLALIGVISIQKVVGPVVATLLALGTITGFLFSWYIKNARPPHIDTFIGMLSLASVVVILSKLYETQLSFENLLRIFSTALAWLSLFQAFGINAQKSYSLIQFISAALLISSVSLALEQETIYVLYATAFLFILIFTMRLSMVCERQSRGSLIIGDKDEILSLWHQIKIGAIMFSIVLILSGLVYPAVPRFNSLSLSWIPSTLLGLPDNVPILKLMKSADKTIKDAKVKKEQVVDDGTKHRETKGEKADKKDFSEKDNYKDKKKEKTERFKASDFNNNIDAFKLRSLNIKADKTETQVDQQVRLTAEIRLNDGSVIPATKLVDWKVTGTAKVSMDKDARMTPKEEGSISVSASYMGVFSNDVNIKINKPLKPKKKKGFLFWIFIILLWILAAAAIIFSIRVFIRAQRLAEMRKNNPRRFIKEIYFALCKAFKIYGIPKFNYTAYREFYVIIKTIIEARPEPMQALTEGFLEARFSEHEISTEHSQKAIDMFHEVKDVVLERDKKNALWKNILFRISVAEVLLIPRRES